MRLFLTGGTGVLGRALEPLAGPAGHTLSAPSHHELGHGPLYDVYGTTLHVADAASALLAALSVPSGIYNVCRDDERVSNERFKRAAGWLARHAAE